MKDLQAHSNDVWQNDIGRQTVGEAHRQNPWKPVVRSIKNDEDDQPNTDYAQAEYEKPLEKEREESHGSLSRLVS
jgi:hypothetical protein